MILNHTEHAYHDAVNRLKSMLADTYNTVKYSNRRVGYDYDDTDNIPVNIFSLYCFMSSVVCFFILP